MGKEIASRVIEGLIGAGLMKIRAPPPSITASKEEIVQTAVARNSTYILYNEKYHRFAIVVFWGDGDHQIELRILIGGNLYAYIYGDERSVVTIANNTLKIIAQNNDNEADRFTPYIEILSLTW